MFIVGFSVFFVVAVVWFFWYRKNVIKQLPDVSQINEMVFSQTTIIQDRHGETLYKLFHENREYVSREDISPIMVNAIVAMEDQRYREHGWLDPKWILRAALSRVFPFLWDPGGWSTLSQQLLKNLLLSTDGIKESTKDKVIRKFKEFSLTSKLEDVLETQITKEQGKLAKDDLRKEMKKKTLELYLNYISFGNNAYGIEAAAKTYFDKSAIDLDVLESSVLASIPKWPTKYNPLRYHARVMWDLEVLDPNGKKVNLDEHEQLKKIVLEKITTVLTKSDLSNMDDNGAFTKFVKWLWSYSVFADGKTYRVTYKIWRKDAVLSRMYEDWYINELDLKNAFLKWLNFTFRKHRFEIKAPHFVHWIIEYLNDTYDEETLLNGGLIVKTTLDYGMQKLAEDAIRLNKDNVDYYGANNEAMMFVDSLNWDVLSYVWSIDYFDEDIEWQNDMLRSPRQVWSSMKPFIYSLAFEKIPLTLDTPIFDIPFKAWRDTPNNADGKFYGIMPLRMALAHSRNIPAIKTFLALWWEPVAKPFLQQLWFVSLLDEHSYGYPMALWAWEVEMLELVNAYMHLSARWKPAVMNPILEIRSSDGALLYKKEVEHQPETIKPGVASLLWNILKTDSGNMPAGWVGKYSVRWLLLAIKSWTSNMKIDWNRNRARDWLLVWYTPSKVAVFRWWNADGSPMNSNAYWWFLNAKAMTTFYWSLLKNNYISNENMVWVETNQVTINKISWRLATEKTPSAFKVTTMWYAYNQVGLADAGMSPIVYDKGCNGLASPYTPVLDVAHWYLIEPVSFMPNAMDLKDIKERWTESLSASGISIDAWGKRPRITYNYSNIFIQEPLEYCEWRMPREDDSISVEIMKPVFWWGLTSEASVWFHVEWDRGINRILWYLDDIQVFDVSYVNKKTITDIQNFVLWDEFEFWKHRLKVEAIDKDWYSNNVELIVDLVKEDKEPPTLMKNKISVKLNDEWTYDVVLIFEDKLSSVVWWEVRILDSTKWDHFDGNLAVFSVDELSQITVVVTDGYGNVLKEDINLNKYYVE